MDRDTNLEGMKAALYLRKSRAEEGMETEEVLARHQSELLEYAASHKIEIGETYPEVVSGESLYARPQMLRLLQDVEDGQYDAVLCMDLDRLSRGRMRDQGLILDTLKYTGTLIITPDKVYNLDDDIDEEYAELKTFMARREYKIINKRLQRGLQHTIKEGCYVANAPYGYRKTVIDRKPTLEIYEPEAKFVRLMFELYTQGYGCVAIAKHINELGAKPHRSDQFTRNSVLKILMNPTYVGKIVWDQKTHIRKGTRGNEKHVVIYNPPEKWTIVDGLHPPLVSRELFDKVQEIHKGRYVPASNDGTVKNPLVGLIKCGNCGDNMQKLGQKPAPYIVCQRAGCCASAQLHLVEQRVLDYLQDVLDEIRLSGQVQEVADNRAVLLSSLEAARKDLAAAQRQKARLHELLELGEYDIPTYRERMEAVRAKIAHLEQVETDAAQRLQDASQADPMALAKKIEALLEAYPSADAPGRNALLRSVITVIWYYKDKKTKPADFHLDIRLSPS